MNGKLRLLIAFLVVFSTVSAKNPIYPVQDIPATLKENAHTVIRNYQQEIEIKSEKSAVVTISIVSTILNKNGLRDGFFHAVQNPMNRVFNVRGKLYDESGKQVKTFGPDDVEDFSMIQGYSLYEDNRIKLINPKYVNYPYTIEYSYQTDMKQTLFLPTWSHNDENTSYENSVLILKTPAGYPIRYKEYNLPASVSKVTKDGKDIYSWKISNLKAKTDEPMASVYTPESPTVTIVPENFTIGDSKGTSSSWKSLGLWATDLMKDRDKLPDATIAKLKEITANCKTDLEKVKAVYEFMQLKTRYVNLSIGIGGWQPFEATTVEKYSYGDCKALSNYTHALLSSIGVKSYYTLVRAGADADAIDDKFPSSQFNHAFVCVPLEKDTVWLECTSQRLPCGFNSDFTDDRNVLLVDGENSKLVHTRVYQASENYISRTTSVKILDENTGTATVNSDYKGLSYDEILPLFYADNADKKKRLTNRIKLPSFTLDNFSITENRSKTPVFNEKLNLSLTYYIKKLQGDIALLPLNFINKAIPVPEKVRNRKTDMCIRRAFLENDTVNYELPKEFTVTELPANQTVTTQFGKYISVATKKANTITFARHFELFKGVFPPEAYADFRDFMEQVSSADEAVATLKKI